MRKRLPEIELFMGLFMSVLLFCCPTPASAYRLPDSDQRKCYRDVSPYDEIPCAGTGQDGAYIQNPLSYTVNGDEVTDNNTGLIWQREDDGYTYNWYQATGTYDASSNPTGINACGSFGRLPSRKELMSIVDYAIPYPGPTIHPVFTNTKTYTHWSATSHYWPFNAWLVYFQYGDVDDVSKNETMYVRCVRGGQTPGPTLIDNGNDTVTDTRTGLIWEQLEPGAMTWGAALSYCEDRNLGGSTSWRLPNIKELASLVDDTKWDPSIDTSKFPNVFANEYWSSTSTTSYLGDPNYPNSARDVNFGSGKAQATHKVSTSYVRCVRGGQSGSFGWRSGESDLGGGWKWTNWFGIYNTTYEPWIYHAQHGWLYPYDNGNDAVFFWYNDMQQFVWTNPTVYPFLYRFGVNPAWLWYVKDSSNPRMFYNYTSGVWESLP